MGALFGADFKTRVVNGVPRIEMNDSPICARWFYACPGRMPVVLHEGEQTLELLKEAIVDEECQITFHFRFPKTSGEYYFDDFQVIDETTGKDLIPKDSFDAQPYGPFLSLPDKSWQIWPRNENEKYFGAEITDFPGEKGNKALKLHFSKECDDDPSLLPNDPHLYRSAVPVRLAPGKTYRIRCRIWSSRETMMTPGFYIPHPIAYRSCLSDAPGSDSAFSRQLKYAHNAGVDFITTVITIPWPEKDGDELNFANVDLAMRFVLASNPNAFIVPRIRLDASKTWMDEHPDELVKWAPGGRGAHPQTASVSSRLWRRDSLKYFKETIKYLEEHFPNNIAGYHVCGLETWEWFYKSSWQQDYHGYSPAEINAFRKWLKAKYHTDEALRKAWKRDNITFQNALVPSPKERDDAAQIASVLDPARSQNVIDHNEFLQDEVADMVIESAHAIKEITGDKRLSVVFYGYINIFGGMNRMSASGHLDNRRVLNCPDIDIMVSPIDYNDREEGGAALAMTAAESVLRAGKMWFFEDDTRTYLATRGSLAGVNTYVHDKTHSHNVLLRNTSEEIVRNFGCWWMDLASVGWFDDPYLWNAMSALREMEEKKLAAPRPFEPAIAATASERSAVFTKNGFNLNYPAYAEIRSKLSRCGASSGMYYLEDVVANGIPSNVVVVGNAWVLDARERAALKEKLQGKTVLWCHAPGIVDPETGISLANTKELTGFQIVRRKGDDVSNIRCELAGRLAGLPEQWTVRAVNHDNFEIKTLPGDEILAVWNDNAAPAVVKRGNAIFCASAEIPRELATYALHLAGEHVFTEDEVVLYTDGSNLVLHATKNTPENVSLKFPNPVKLRNIVTGEWLTETPATAYSLPMKFADTVVLEMVP